MAVIAVAAAVAGCASGGTTPATATSVPGTPPTSIGTAADGTVEVTGWLVQEGSGQLMICSMLLSSLPAQCGQGIPVVGVDISQLSGVTTDHGVSWTEDQVTLEGTLNEGVLIVDQGATSTTTTQIGTAATTTTTTVESTPTTLPVIGQWAPMPVAPVARGEYVPVWTGTELLVWGNPFGLADTQATGDIFDPSTGLWRSMAPAPQARSQPAAVWTGSRLIIWGGDRAGINSNDYDPANDGFAYDPTTDTWTAIPAAPIQGRTYMFNVWTGTELIVWGGMVAHDGMLGAVDDGAAYDPTTGTWRVLAPSPLGAKNPGVGIWTGQEMIIGANGDATDGDPSWASYDPATDSWSKIADPPGVRSSNVYRGVWTGTEVLFAPFGDPTTPAPLAAYNPDQQKWRLTAAPPVNVATVPAVWTDGWVVFWGHTAGSAAGIAPMVGVAYNPASDTWAQLAQDSLGTRWIDTLVATGDGVIVWGGYSTTHPGSSLRDDGAILTLPPSTTP